MKCTSLVVVTAALLTIASSSSGAPASPAPSAAARAPAAPAASTNIDEARLRFRRGVELYRDGDFRAALAEFKRANELGPSYRILYNIGQAQIELRNYPAARKTFVRYLEEGGSEISKERADEIAALVATCSERVAEVTVRVNRPGAELFVDDVSIGSDPPSGLVIVGAGRRKISARVAGLPPVMRFVEVTGGDKVTVELSLDAPVARPKAPVTAARPMPLGPPARAPQPPPNHAPFWLSLAVTGALGVATVTTGVLALSTKGHIDRDLNRVDLDPDLASERTRLKTLSAVTDILGAATVVGLGVTTYLGFTTLGSRKGSAVRVGIGPGSVAAGGRF